MNRQKGIALPMVLWAIAFLAGLVILLGVRIKERTDENSQAERAFRARQLALRGLAFGMHPQVQEGDPLLKSGDPEAEAYEVVISDDSGRINPNYWVGLNDTTIFQNLFATWEVERRISDAAIDSLRDWIDEDDLKSLAGAEYGDYQEAGMDGLPPNQPLGDIREMSSVLNLREVLAEQENWRDLFTLHHSGRVNINHAEDRLLTELAGLQPRQIEAMREFQAGKDGEKNTEDDLDFEEMETVLAVAAADGRQADLLEKYFSTEGEARRIESTGTCYGVTRKITVVTAGSGNILAWEEQ